MKVLGFDKDSPISYKPLYKQMFTDSAQWTLPMSTEKLLARKSKIDVCAVTSLFRWTFASSLLHRYTSFWMYKQLTWADIIEIHYCICFITEKLSAKAGVWEEWLQTGAHVEENWELLEPVPFSQFIKPLIHYEARCYADVIKMEIRSCLEQNTCP